MTAIRRRLFVKWASAVSAALCSGFAGCLGFLDGPVERTKTVELTDDGFDPKNIKVDEGAAVSWENKGSVTHIVVAKDDFVNLEAEIEPGKLTNHKFGDGGVYEISCSEHSGERMKIAVGDTTIKDPVE